MPFHLIIIKSPPYAGRQSHEILEAVMSLALFDVKHRVVFFEQGVRWLLTHQSPEQQKSLEKQLAALPMYGSENLYYCTEHAEALFNTQTLNEDVAPVSTGQLSDWVKQARHVEVF